MDETDGIPRRWILIGAVAAVGGGAVGGLAGLLPDRSPSRPRANPPPAALVAAAATEQALIADLDATTGGTFTVRQVVAAARGDHAEHLRVLRGLLARYDAAGSSASPSPSPSPSPSTSRPSAARGTPRTRAQLRAAERRAATAAARRAEALGGAVGAVLASVSACEATHAELFG